MSRKYLVLLCLFLCLTSCMSSPADNSGQNESISESTTEEPTQVSSGDETQSETASEEKEDTVSFDDVQYFDEDGQAGFYDPDGNKVLLSERYSSFTKFAEGRMTVYTAEGMGVIDRYGNELAPPIYDGYDSDRYYKDGFLIVTVGGHEGGRDAMFESTLRYGVLDINGNEIIPANHQYILSI